jgi:hypothetical protein
MLDTTDIPISQGCAARADYHSYIDTSGRTRRWSRWRDVCCTGLTDGVPKPCSGSRRTKTKAGRWFQLEAGNYYPI